MTAFTGAELATLHRVAGYIPDPAGERFAVECADHLRRVHPDLDDATLGSIVLTCASLAALVHTAGWDAHPDGLAKLAGVYARMAVHLASLELETGAGE